MGWKRHEAEEHSIAQRILRDGTNLDRRSLFVSAAAFGAVAASAGNRTGSASSRSACYPLLLLLLLRAGSS